MSAVEAREVLGLTEHDEWSKTGLEGLREAELRLLEYEKNPVEQKRIKLWVKAINTLLKFKDYMAA